VIADRRMASPSSLYIRQERAVLLANELAACRRLLRRAGAENLGDSHSARSPTGWDGPPVQCMLWLRALEKLRQNLETNGRYEPTQTRSLTSASGWQDHALARTAAAADGDLKTTWTAWPRCRPG
jgi:hypothetical protein